MKPILFCILTLMLCLPGTIYGKGFEFYIGGGALKATGYVNRNADTFYLPLPYSGNSVPEKSTFMLSAGFYNDLSKHWRIGAHISVANFYWTELKFKDTNGVILKDFNKIHIAEPLLLGHISVTRNFELPHSYLYVGVKVGFAYAREPVDSRYSYNAVGSSFGLCGGYAYKLGKVLTIYLDGTITSLSITYLRNFSATNFLYMGSMGIRISV